MKIHISLFSFILCILFLSCKPDERNYEAILQDSWICKEINGSFLPTDEYIWIHFQKNEAFSYGAGYPVENGSHWLTSDQYHYSVQGRLLSFSGTDGAGNQHAGLYKAERMTGQSIDFHEEYTLLNNQKISEGRTLTFTKSNIFPSLQVAGIWDQRQRFSQDSTGEFTSRYEIAPDRSFTLFTKQGNGWVQNTDMDGNCFYSGQVLAFNYTDNSHTPPLASFECLLIEGYTSGKIMVRKWEKTNLGGTLQGSHYEFIKEGRFSYGE